VPYKRGHLNTNENSQKPPYIPNYTRKEKAKENSILLSQAPKASAANKGKPPTAKHKNTEAGQTPAGPL